MILFKCLHLRLGSSEFIAAAYCEFSCRYIIEGVFPAREPYRPPALQRESNPSQEHGMFRHFCSPGRAHSSQWQRQCHLHPPEPWHRVALQQSSYSVWLVLSLSSYSLVQNPSSLQVCCSIWPLSFSWTSPPGYVTHTYQTPEWLSLSL